MYKALACKIFLLIVCIQVAPATAQPLVPFGSTWKYLDDGTNQGTVWRQPGFSDTGWKSGNAKLGYGVGDEATVISYGPKGSNKYITYYFRRPFEIADASSIASASLKLNRDDGGVVYINGTEVYRSNMPEGEITYTTLAPLSQNRIVSANIDISSFVTGTNIVAVEIHQNAINSPDIGFDLELTATQASATPAITRGPYLQMIRPNAATIRWRTNLATDSRVWHSTNATTQNNIADNATVSTEHEVTVTGLNPGTMYYYKIGSTSGPISPIYSFQSAPDDGHPWNTRMWFVGDSGMVASTAQSVKESYQNFSAGRYTNLMFFLGDSAYNSGTDSEFQSKLFDVFADVLRNTSSVAALGERDTAGSTNPSLSIPYFNVFNLPTTAEAGGYRSGTEKYYSFNYGTIHVVVLDSQASSRATDGAMLKWLQEDLTRNKRSWRIAVWHHSPYSKGNYDSDLDLQMSEMRANVNRILEDYGVDLVVTAHSNTYERSFLIDGHYGTSNTFTNSMKRNGGSGRPVNGGEYKKQVNSVHTGTVYAIVGSSAGAGTGPLNHPAMYMSLARAGSLVVDVNCTKMDVRFIGADGTELDHFQIRKLNTKPVATITTPANNSTFKAPATITISADAFDPDNNIRRIRFYRNDTRIATDYTNPFSIIWTDVKPGTYTLTAKIEDDVCTYTVSDPVTITVVQ